MADTGRRMQVDEAGVAGCLRIAVGHADHASFLQAEYVVDVTGPVAQEGQFGRAGIAEDFFDAERAQQVEGRLLDGEGGAGFAGQCLLRRSGMVRKHQIRNLEIPGSMLRIAPE